MDDLENKIVKKLPLRFKINDTLWGVVEGALAGFGAVVALTVFPDVVGDIFYQFNHYPVIEAIQRHLDYATKSSYSLEDVNRICGVGGIAAMGGAVVWGGTRGHQYFWKMRSNS